VQESIRNRLLADISHELKTPITSIQCYLEGISDGVIKLSEKNLEAISSEMNRLIKLVNLIMDYEKFENKKLELHYTQENIKTLLREIALPHKTQLKETHQKIKITGSEIHLSIDKDLFTQMVHNVISNFRKYAGENTTLNIQIEKDFLTFKDNGK